MTLVITTNVYPPKHSMLVSHFQTTGKYDTHHNKNNFKNQLDLVERGEVIASVGSSGISSVPHLHFEVWREFTPLDPLIYFPEFSLVDLTSINE